MRGTALAASLPEPRPFIVFATAFENYALEAIAVDATDYLLKPVSRAKLAATLDRVRVAARRRQTVERDIVAASDVQAHMWPGSLPPIRRLRLRGRVAAGSRRRRRLLRSVSDRECSGCSGCLALGAAARRRVGQGRRGRPRRVGGPGTRATPRLGSRTSRPAALMAAVDRDVLRHDRRRALRDRDLRRARRRHIATDARQCRPSGGAGLVRRPASDDVDGHGPGARLDRRRHVRLAHASRSTPGTLLVAYTDGVSEARNDADDEFGEATADRICSMAAAIARRRRLRRDPRRGSRVSRRSRQDQDDVTASWWSKRPGE